MSEHTHIHVKRYASPESLGYQATIEPADRRWLVFVDKDGDATMWRRVSVTSYPGDPLGAERPATSDDEGKPTVDVDGKVEHFFVDVELPGTSIGPGHPLHPVAAALPMPEPAAAHPGPLDFEVTQQTETVEGVPAGTWTAWLNCRSVGCTGATEHEAVRNLLNYVARLCTAGSLDHTGRPMIATSRRRYEAVFGQR